MKPQIAILVGSLLAAPIAAQQQTPVFRSGANLVALEVTAVDKDGKPVKGLTAADFAVTLEGQQRTVQTVDYVEFGSGSSRAAAATDAAPVAGAAPKAPVARERRVVVILFDDLSIKPGEGKAMTSAAQRTLAQFGPDDLVGVAVTSGLVPAINPTTDHKVVDAAIGKLVGRADDYLGQIFMSSREADEISRDVPTTTLGQVAARECEFLMLRIEQCEPRIRGTASGYVGELKHRATAQIDAYRQIVAAMKKFTGSRVIISLSDGVATNLEKELLQSRLEVIMKDAAESGVHFYAMAEEPDYTSAASMGSAKAKTSAGDMTRTQARIEHARIGFDGLAAIAIAAGGEAFHSIGQPDRLFARIEAETSAIYRLAIDAPAGADKTRFLDAQISVNRPGVIVRANRKVLSPNAVNEAVPVDQQLRSALLTAGDIAAVPVTMSAQLLPANGSARQVGVSVQLPSDVRGPLIVMFSIVDAEGKSLQAGRKELPQPANNQEYRFNFGLSIAAAGSYSVRVAVADANGRIGRKDAGVVVPGGVSTR